MFTKFEQFIHIITHTCSKLYHKHITKYARNVVCFVDFSIKTFYKKRNASSLLKAIDSL